MASVRVAVRVRPLTKREKQLSSKVIVQLIGTTIFINKPLPAFGDEVVDRRKAFSYDYSYDSTDKGNATYASQDKIFQDLGLDVLKTAFEGFNACVFAFGQTGSGKSYTMMGDAHDKGLTPRICSGLLSEMDRRSKSDGVSFCTEVSYLEIYNERVQDLLRDKSMPADGVLKVREHPVNGPYVENLSKHTVHKHNEMEDLIALGNTNRTTASTGMNKSSSRSHTIFTIGFTQTWSCAEQPRETQSKIHLVDLAGSERVDATRATGTRLKEGGSINKSLVTLGSVISTLADSSVGGQSSKKRKQIFIPYRDSVLTWLLKDSLGGNSVTTMIATISPADINYNETLSTLRYASRAKSIVNSPMVNEDGSVKVIRELQAEVARLRGLLQEANQVPCVVPPVKVKKEPYQTEALSLTKEWTCKWNRSHIMLEEGTMTLRVEGSGVVLDCRLPHLIGTNALGTGMALYYLKEGSTLIGSDAALCSQGIVLRGPGVLAEHCMLQNCAGVVTMFPQVGALCSVNGSPVEDACQLTQGCITQLGAGTFLLFNHPAEAAQLGEKQKSGLPPASPLSLTDVSKATLHHLSQSERLPVETERMKLSAATHMKTTATPGNHPKPHSCFELDGDILWAAVSTRDGLEHEGDQCHKSGPELMSKWPLKAQSGAQVGTYKEEEARPGDASLQETSVLGQHDGCGTKPEGNANKIQDVMADYCEGRRRSGGSLLSRTSHPQCGAGAGSASVLPQTSGTSPRLPSSQTVYCPPERTSSEEQAGCEAANQSRNTGVCATNAASESGSRLGSLVSRVSGIAQDARHLLWSSANVLQRVRKRGISPVGACWSSYFFSLVMESRVLSAVNNSRVVCRVKGTFTLFLIRHGGILSTLKGLPLLQHINTMVVQNLQLEEAAQMLRDIKQLQARAEESPDSRANPPDVYSESCKSRSLQRRHLSQDRVERAISGLAHREEVLFFRQTLISFPPALSELQSLPLPDLQDVLQDTTAASVLGPLKVSALYWLSVATCCHVKPRPALLVLAEAALYALTADSGLLVLSHHLPLSELTEIRVGMAGLAVHLTASAPDSTLVVYTHSQELTKEVCFSVLAAARPEDCRRVSEHPLMTGDLMALSLDWQSHVPELQLGAGLRLCSHFQKSLVDLAYLIHCNAADDRLSLGDVHVLLYTSVGIRGGDVAPVAQFFLTDTHLGLLQEEVVFGQDSQPLFRSLALRRCLDVRCVLVHDEDEGGAVRLDVVLAKGHGPQSETEAATPSAHVSDLSLRAEVWKLTFSCCSEAASLINHLSNESGAEQAVMNRAA